MTVIVMSFLGSTHSGAQPIFKFCGFSYTETDGVRGMIKQIKELPQCEPGTDNIWRVRFDPNRSDPSHIAAMVCDFSKQILIHEAQGEHTVTCVVRDAPLFGY